jgi:hypothetical protein
MFHLNSALISRICRSNNEFSSRLRRLMQMKQGKNLITGNEEKEYRNMFFTCVV